jgi:uncharacterized Zn finger protein
LIPYGRLDREKLIELIGGEQTDATERLGFELRAGDPRESSDLQPEPISTEIADFWHGPDSLGDFGVDVQAPLVTAPLLKRLGSFPFWRSNRRFVDVFEQIYVRASLQATKVLVGESLIQDKKPRS